MALQHRLLFLPPGTERISEHLAAAHHDGRLTFFDASGPIFSCREEDEGALRFAAAMLTEPGLGLAGPSQIARAVRRHRSQVHEYRARYREGGAGALEVRKRGPRGASKLKGPVLAAAQAGLTAGLSNCKVAAQVGVSEQTIRKGLKDGRLVRQPGGGRRRARWRQLKIVLNPKTLDKRLGREVLNGFCRCFVHADRLTSAVSCAYTSRKHHGVDSVAHHRDLNTMMWFSIGTLRELARAINGLRKALEERKLVDFADETWVKLNDVEKRWRNKVYKNMRDSGAFHVDKDVIDKGLDELVQEQSVTLADVGQKRVNSSLWLGYLALHNGLGLNYGELLDMVMADHEVVADAIQHVFILATNAAGVPFPGSE